MKGLDTNAVDAKAKNIIVKQPGINKNYYLFTRVVSPKERFWYK